MLLRRLTLRAAVIVFAGDEAAAADFESILFEQSAAGSGVTDPGEPDYFADLNLDQVLESMTAGREQYELKLLFCTPLHDADAIGYGMRFCAVSRSMGCSSR